ncbi:hypothetical protein SAMN04487996_104297 [Dyadobacter soli]|uniref:Uncharacterized protein n=1 Tax=Dyadobacter soli TaxID=659014 RepID=A0A1G7BSR3_9BACT|nr:hypothetical protein [Dyadobacter soli]SDE30027.1 hypothetical protein SAMN04487996_104297 [Dyadobacter soli]
MTFIFNPLHAYFGDKEVITQRMDTIRGYLTVKGRDALESYVQPQQWNIRAGILFRSPDVFNNRLQFAWMTLIPVSNLSLRGFKSVRSPNMQVSLRFLVK